MESAAWDARYAGSELVWSAEPNQWVVEICAGLEPGRALDLAAGEGRNAIWLVENGWDVTAVDFSAVAVERMQQLAEQALGNRAMLTPVVGDARESQGSDMDLVLFCYLHLPEADWAKALESAVGSCTPGGRVVVIGHARRNLTEGVGGPQNPAILYDPEHVTALLEALPEGVAVEVERAEIARRPVTGDSGVREALDTIVIARRR